MMRIRKVRVEGDRAHVPGRNMGIPRAILLVSTGAGRNIGDRAILVNVARRLRDQFPGVEMIAPAQIPAFMVADLDLHRSPTLFQCWGRMGWDDLRRSRLGRVTLGVCYAALTSLIFVSALIGRQLLQRLPLRSMETEFIESLARADIVHLCGGGYLTDYGRGECRAALCTAWMGLALGKPVILTGQGIGPVSNWLTRFLLRRVLRRAVHVGVRDDGEGRRLACAAGAPVERVEEAADDATSLPRAPVLRSPARKLSICLRASSFHRIMKGGRFLAEWDRFLAGMEAMEWDICFLAFHEHIDFEVALYEETIGRIGLDRATIVRDPDPRALRARVAECHAAVCNTFHAALFALSEGIPSLALWDGEYYRRKIESLLRQYGRPEWAVQIDKFEAAGAIMWASALNLEIEETHLLPRAAALAGINDAALIRAYERAASARLQRQHKAWRMVLGDEP